MNKLPKIGNTELYTVRVLNMSVAQYYGVVKEYNQIVVATRELNKKELEKNGEKAELNLYYSVRYNLNLLVFEKICESKSKREILNILKLQTKEIKKLQGDKNV